MFLDRIKPLDAILATDRVVASVHAMRATAINQLFDNVLHSERLTDAAAGRALPAAGSADGRAMDDVGHRSIALDEIEVGGDDVLQLGEVPAEHAQALRVTGDLWRGHLGLDPLVALLDLAPPGVDPNLWWPPAEKDWLKHARSDVTSGLAGVEIQHADPGGAGRSRCAGRRGCPTASSRARRARRARCAAAASGSRLRHAPGPLRRRGPQRVFDPFADGCCGPWFRRWHHHRR